MIRQIQQSWHYVQNIFHEVNQVGLASIVIQGISFQIDIYMYVLYKQISNINWPIIFPLPAYKFK